MKKTILLLSFLTPLIPGFILSAQKEGTIVMSDIVRQHARQEILDNPEGEKTGRADFVV